MKLWFASLISLSLSSAWGCCPPENVSVIAQRIDGECVLDLDYEGTALGVYVIEPIISSKESKNIGKEVEFPRSNSKFDGLVFFGLDTTTFPDGIVPPVRYGVTEKDRAVDTKNAYMHTDNAMYNQDVNGTPVYEAIYPMPLQSANVTSCAKPCQLSTNDPQGQPVPAGQYVKSFKVGVVSLPGNTETPPLEDKFKCPTGPGMPEQFGTDLPRHFGAD